MDFAGRLKMAREKAGLKQNELADMCGMSQGAISKIERRDQKDISFNYLSRIARALQCDRDWLFYGNNDIDPGSAFMLEDIEGAKVKHIIPYLNIEGSCGSGSNIYDGQEAEIKGVIRKEPSWFVKYKVKPEDAFCVYAKGDSMSMFIIEGDMVIFDRSKIEPISGKIFLIRHPDGLKIKRLAKNFTGDWQIESLNESAEKPEVITSDMIDRVNIVGQFVYRQGGD